jgi:homoserine O-succinyltransferase
MIRTLTEIAKSPWPLQRDGPAPATDRRRGAPLRIGLVNNLPARGRQAAARQFRQLIAHRHRGVPVRLRLFAPAAPRTGLPDACGADGHEPLDALWTSELDGLIVTGAEPRAASLTEEPGWPSLTRLVAWAETRTVSTIWSCLAAHAAVYRLDGIQRRTFPRKLSGLFECAAREAHDLVEGLPRVWSMPHSRYNELPEEELILRGYRILVRSQAAGADTFIKETAALHVCLQGHPEYDWAALSREYRRDVRRYLAGESERYPETPEGYFPAAAEEALRAFRERALLHRHGDLLAQFPAAAMPKAGAAPWADVAARFYANWLSVIAQRRDARMAAVLPRGRALA